MQFFSPSQPEAEVALTPAGMRTALAAQLQAHRASAPVAGVSSAMGAAMLLAMLTDSTAPALMALWASALAAALLLRLAVQRTHRIAHRHDADADTGTDATLWLARYRACVLLHGVVWGMAALLPADLQDPGAQAALIIVLGGSAVATMPMTVFDLRAAMLFVLPVLLPLVLRVLLTAVSLQPVSLLAAGMLMLLLIGGLVAGLRARRVAAALASARRAEAAGVAGARRAEGLLHLIFDHATEGIAVFDSQQQLAAWNLHFADFAGIDPRSLHLGMPLRECLRQQMDANGSGPGEPRDEDVERHAAALLDPRPGVTQRQRADGRTIETRRSPVPGGGFITVCVDVTERNAAEGALREKQRMLALLLENTGQGFWFIDNALRTTDANPAMCRLLGVPREQMLGRVIYDFVDAENAAIFHNHVALRAAGQAGTYEVALLRADGTLVHCLNNATPTFDETGRKTGALGLFSDITAQKGAEAQIRRSGELLAQKSHVLEVTLDSLAQGVLSIDAQGRSNAWNRRFMELLQLPESLMQTRPTLRDLVAYQAANGHFGHDLDRFTGDDDGRIGMARYLAGDSDALVKSYQRTRADGTIIEVQAHVAEDGSWVRTYTDITASAGAEQALRDSESRFRTMADGAPALIWLAASDGTPTWFNQRWLQYTGRSMQDELQAAWRSRMHPDDYTRGLVAFTVALEQRSAYDIEFRLLGADGRWGWIADTGIPRFGPSGSFDGFISYGWDISARKAAESALIAARDEAERANRAKSEFLSRMSHELRTPMNAILGFGQLMQSDADDPLSTVQQGRLHELLHGGRHLLALINEVLDLARIEAGNVQLRLQPVDVAPLVAECLRLVAPLAAQRGIVLLQEGPARHAVADPARLRQVLLNLLSNAVKYNREGGHVDVRCSDEGPLIRIDIRDGGPGISAAQQQRLFQPFERLDADQSAVEGAGIGLALSKWLVDLMHGEIGVDSQPGNGSTFWVRLARAQPATSGTLQQLPLNLFAAPATVVAVAAHDAVAVADRAPPPALDAGSPVADVVEPAAAPRLHTVLYVEDNPVNQLLMEGMLAYRPNVRLLLADLPAPGLQMAAEALPDLVLLDIQLPGMDGFEVLRRLRLLPATRDIPVVAVSANAMQSDIDGAMRAGFRDYVTKPLDMQRLLAVVDKALEGAST